MTRSSWGTNKKGMSSDNATKLRQGGGGVHQVLFSGCELEPLHRKWSSHRYWIRELKFANSSSIKSFSGTVPMHLFVHVCMYAASAAGKFPSGTIHKDSLSKKPWQKHSPE